MSFYRWLKWGLTIAIPLENDEALYYRHRDRFNALLTAGHHDTAEAAALFYYLNRTGYNGLCRFNKSGEFNVPFGQYQTIHYTRDFSEYREAFAEWELTNVDIEELPVEPHDFVYADPPYDVEFTQYSRGGFDWQDQVRTAEWLARHRGPVLLSNQATARVVDLYQRLGFELRYLEAPRMISCTGDRSKAREVLAVKNV
jgi:DNA adenine methylase